LRQHGVAANLKADAAEALFYGLAD